MLGPNPISFKRGSGITDIFTTCLPALLMSMFYAHSPPPPLLSVSNFDDILPSHADIGLVHTTDPEVDLAATLMRILFIKDLRDLQNDIDDSIVDVQVMCMSKTYHKA